MDLNSFEIHRDSWKIKQHLCKVIPEIYNYNFHGEIYMLGSAVKKILINEPYSDIDIVVLSDNSDINDFVLKQNLSYDVNSFGGYKINTKSGINVDLWSSNDLYKCVKYTSDGLFYNIKHEIVIPFGFFHSIGNKKVLTINNDIIHPNINREEDRYLNAKNIISKFI